MIKVALHKNHRKFSEDSIDYEDEHYEIQTDGIFLGIRTNGKKGLAPYIIAAYESRGELFARELRGSFLLYLHDKRAGKKLIYTNHTGDKRIYYYHEGKNTIVSTSMKYITSWLKQHQISYSMDHHAAYYILSYGFPFGDRTIVNEVKRLKSGHYIRSTEEDFQSKCYFTLGNTPEKAISKADAIEQVDTLFRNAISLEYEKDRDYGLTPLTSLSGGLDCRMTTWVGHEMGYTNMNNFTFAQSGSLDMKIPAEIVQKLDHPWIFKPLDGGEFICQVEEVSRLTEGNIYYLPLSHGKYAIDQVDFDDFGLLHSGQLGDVTLGSYCKEKTHDKPSFSRPLSSRLVYKLPEADLEPYTNMEMLLYLNRGFNFILSGNMPVQQYSEVSSPFLDVDFLEFCMQLPLEYRIHHTLYKKWILEKYPGAAEFKWEQLGRKITAKTLRIRGKDIPFSQLPSFAVQGALHHLNRDRQTKREKNKGMNPFQFWYNTNESVAQYIEQYFRENIGLLEDRELRGDSTQLFTRGNIYEKAQVLSLIAAVKLHWD